MAYQKQYTTKKDFMRDRINMALGSLATLYSNPYFKEPPDADGLLQKAIETTEKIWTICNTNRYDDFPELDEKLENLVKEETEGKKVGRYHSSELWALLNGRVNPEDYTKPRQFTREDMERMKFGVIIHEGIQKLFDFEEKKYELKIDDEITLVGKIDLELPNGIIEIKSKEDIESYYSLPDWYDFQCQAYMQMKGVKEMRLYLVGWAFTRRLFMVKRNETRWKNIIKGLKEYHEKVKEAN